MPVLGIVRRESVVPSTLTIGASRTQLDRANDATKYNQRLECAPRAGRDYAAVLTVCRA